jgi:hypothetical protein
MWPRYWTWWLASYLLGKGNASALYVTPVFPDGAAGDQYTYGRSPWFRERYLAASAIGHPVRHLEWRSPFAAVREFSNGFVAANGHALGSPQLQVVLPPGKCYTDLTTGVGAAGTIDVVARNATILLAAPCDASGPQERLLRP